MGRKPKDDPRVSLSRLVAGATTPLLKNLALSLGISEGEVIDRAVQTLAICESFGPSVIKVAPEVQRTTPDAIKTVAEHRELAAKPRYIPPANQRHQRRTR